MEQLVVPLWLIGISVTLLAAVWVPFGLFQIWGTLKSRILAQARRQGVIREPVTPQPEMSPTLAARMARHQLEALRRVEQTAEIPETGDFPESMEEQMIAAAGSVGPALQARRRARTTLRSVQQGPPAEPMVEPDRGVL